MVLDDALEERIGEILDRYSARWPGLDPEAVRASNRKQAIVPAGATILDPVGTAPGLVVPPASGERRADGRRAPGAAARAAGDVARGRRGRHVRRGDRRRDARIRQRTLRLYGIPESEIAETLRAAEASPVRGSTASRSRPACGAASSRS